MINNDLSELFASDFADTHNGNGAIAIFLASGLHGAMSDLRVIEESAYVDGDSVVLRYTGPKEEDVTIRVTVTGGPE